MSSAVLSSARLTDDTREVVLVTMPATVDRPGGAEPGSPGSARDVLYPELDRRAQSRVAAESTTTATLVPYYLWGNREPLAMRVWLRRPASS